MLDEAVVMKPLHMHRGTLGWPVGRLVRGMTIVLKDNGDTILAGPMGDQAALHGMLKKVRDLSMPLLSVNTVGDDNTLKVPR